MFKDANISIFAGRGGEKFADRMCAYMGLTRCNSNVHRFSEGTSMVHFDSSVRDRDVYLVQPIGMNPNDQFSELLFWLDAFRRSSAASFTVIMPYFAYAKGDKKDEPHVSVRARVCADCIELCGAARVIVMDLHSPQVVGFFTRPVDHLYALPLLCERFKRMELPMDNMVVVSPDAGFAKQARRFADYLGLPVAIGDKRRVAHDEKAEVLDVIGEVKGKNALIVDDFTISAGTLVNLAKMLKGKGVEKIYAMLSHNIVSKEGVERLNASPIEFVVSTDTVENPNIVGEKKFKTVSVAPLFGESIIRYHNYESLTPLFTSVPESILDASVITDEEPKAEE